MTATGPLARPKLDAAVRVIDQVSLWVLCIGAFALPLVYLRDTYDEFILPKLLFAHVLVVTLLALHAVRWAATGVVSLRRTPLDLPILAFLASAIVSSLFSINRNTAIFGTYMRYEGLLTIVTYAGLFWLAAQTVWRSDRARILVRVMLAAAYVIAIIAIVQWIISTLTIPQIGENDFSHSGFARASATMSNPTMLAAYLVMLIPVGAAEFLEGRSLTSRILAANAVFTMSVALALTFVRIAWFGAFVGVVIALATTQRTSLRLRLSFAGAALAIALAVVGVGAITRGGLPLIHSVVERVVSFQGNLGALTARAHVWEGAVRLVASRPLTGYGPDTFGMVYPRFSTGNWVGGILDKAHSEPLQIAASQGLPGLASYVWMLAAAAVAFWRGRRLPGASAALGGVVAYQIWAQVNFSWVPAALSYWIFLAAAVALWKGDLPALTLAPVPRVAGLVAAVLIGLVLIGLTASDAVRTRSADAYFQQGIYAEARRDLDAARTAYAQARSLGPHESRYALGAGVVALNSSRLGQARWLVAHEAFSDAARLGTYYSAVYYDLALCDIQLNRRREAVAALHRAIDLSPGDPASLALLRQITGA